MISESFLYDLIFKTIFKLPECTHGQEWGCINGVYSHDFIYGLFLPHIIIIIFIYLGTSSLKHKGIATLFGIGIYTFIVYSGWYSLFASLSMFWIVLTLFITGFYFFFGRIFHPSRSNMVFDLVYKKTRESVEKRKRKEALISDIRYLKKKLEKARKIGDTEAIKSISEELTKKELELRELMRS